ncbi:MAG TPA: aldehyde dehydrogenase [Aestuariivirgaceae bacterium]|nr:aldehyde dehydrogenase [Aestuariivirgaceae bacterium]
MKRLQMYIDGKWAAAASGAEFESVDPYRGEPWALVPRADAEDADRAVEAAAAAFEDPSWRDLLPRERADLLFKLADLIARDAERLADLEVRDNGKLMSEMLAQMRYMPQWYKYYGGLADKIEGRVTRIDKPGMFHYITHDPVGVVVTITPWNSPLLLATWKIAPALAAGCTIVAKPSEFTSASILAFAELVEEAGFSPGVFNVVTGFGAEIGDALVRHPKVSKIAFTGGDVGGRSVYESAAKNFKRVSLELGGKSANIVFEDAILEDAVKGVISGIFAATGQTCMAGSRALVHESIYDRFVDELVRVAGAAKIGDPRDPATNIAPVATAPQCQKILGYIETARQDGARCVLGGNQAPHPEGLKGVFVEPTVFADVTSDMRIAQEEVFGPVLAVLKFKNDDDAVRIANDTLYGLAAGIWTQDLGRAIEVPRKLKAGTVWVNAYRVVSYLSPFGGYKHSGIGRENNVEGLMEYLEVKSVFINGRKGIDDPFVMR